MRKVIDGKIYDTETAIKFRWETMDRLKDILGRTPPEFLHINGHPTLYRTPNGNWFLAADRWNTIYKLTPDEALAILSATAPAEVCELYFDLEEA
ncbi:hypothetical protein Q0812_10250 [Brevundimonas sp. 2R-24]|uniref:Uncharacterized protein n=1 Tax=Peiella sedimenti TaxID=3061083 RepID=A0ABT8SMU7_9CAUL|nr:hypothetical protein [Caulobacteraceae bacterium XZ-24]